MSYLAGDSDLKEIRRNLSGTRFHCALRGTICAGPDRVWSPSGSKDRMGSCVCSGMLPHGACTHYLEGQTVANNVNVHKVDDISQGGWGGMALTSAEHDGDGQLSRKSMEKVCF